MTTKKNIGKAAGILLCALICITLAACANKATVAFDGNGYGISVAAQVVEVGQCAVRPENPEREGYVFTGWYLSPSCGEDQEYDFTRPVTENIVLYAGWRQNTATEVSDKNGFLRMKADGNYKLVNDIDLSDTDFRPLGTVEEPFCGTFDGNGHTVKGTGRSDEMNALFGVVSGKILNLTVEADITVEQDEGTVYASLLAARLYGGQISDCYVEGTISAKISDARLSLYVGGIAARNTAGIISECEAQCEITAENAATVYAGGIAGYNGGEAKNFASVEGCLFRGKISSSSSGDRGSAYNGGIVGFNGGQISGCFSWGGILHNVTRSYYGYVGGIVGDNNGGSVKDCVSANDVSAETQRGSTFRGAAVGHNFLDYEFENCYGWDGQKVSLNVTDSAYLLLGRHQFVQSDAVSAEILANAQWIKKTFGGKMKGQDGFLPYIDSANRVQNSLSAPKGTEGNPYLIGNYIELSEMQSDKSYKLANDIDVNAAWQALGTYENPFCGSLDGAGFSIKGLSFLDTNSGYNGLFGYFCGKAYDLNVTASAQISSASKTLQYAGAVAAYNENGIISRCTAEVSFNISGKGVMGGGIAGCNDEGVIYGCNVAGRIVCLSATDTAAAGGIAGSNSGGRIAASGSKAEVEIKGQSVAYAGGVSGKNDGVLLDCYNTGKIGAFTVSSSSGTKVIAGGIVGSNEGSVSSSFSTGQIIGGNAALAVVGGVAGANYRTVDNCYVMVSDIAYGVGYSAVPTDVKFIDDETALANLAEKLGAAWSFDSREGIPLPNREGTL